jgi:hypothetical protein
MCSVEFNMATVSGMAHIKTVFSLSPGTGKYFIGNASCTSDYSITQHIHILHIFTIDVFYSFLKGKSRGVKSGERGGQGIGSIFLSDD